MHRESDRDVRTGADGEVDVGLPGQRRSARVDDHQRGPGLDGGPHVRHQMDAGGRRVRAPDDDEFRVLVVGVGDAGHPAVERGGGGSGRRGADGAREPRGTEPPEELGVSRILGDEPIRPAVGDRENRLAAVTRPDLPHPGRYGVEGFLPAHVPEASVALGADPQSGAVHPVAAVDPVPEAAHLAADVAARDRLPVRAVDAGEAPFLDRDGEAAGVRAVERACGLDRRAPPLQVVLFRHRLSVPCSGQRGCWDAGAPRSAHETLRRDGRGRPREPHHPGGRTAGRGGRPRVRQVDLVAAAGGSGRSVERHHSCRGRGAAAGAAPEWPVAFGSLDGGGANGATGTVPTGPDACILLDEPLASLRGPERAAACDALRALPAAVGTAVVCAMDGEDEAYALAVADRIAVLHEGRLRQCGTPVEVVDAPADEVVARFFGRPRINLAPGILEKDGQAIELGNQTVSLAGQIEETFCRDITLGIRPGHVRLTRDGAGLRGRVHSSEPFEDSTLVRVAVEGVSICALHPGGDRLRAGDAVRMRIDSRHFIVFDDQGVRLDQR